MQKILKVKFTETTFEDVSSEILSWENCNKQRYIVTPNPEIVLESHKNPKFLKILNHADLSVPDGIGILWAAKYLETSKKHKSKIVKLFKWIFSLSTIAIYPKYIRTTLPERITGVDLLKTIVKQTDRKIFLLGAKKGVAKRASEKLNTNKIVETYSGSPQESEAKGIIDRINKSGAEILFVAYGAPAQEIWITRHLKKLKNIKLAVGVGGAFDFIAGERKRAPKWIQKTGLEWFYRIIQEPTRIYRIYNATIKFPLIILKSSFKN